MNATLARNLNILASSTAFFVGTFGIDTDEFITAINGTTLAVIKDYYAEKGVDFDIAETALSEEAMMKVYEHIMDIAQVAMLARAMGLTLEDLKDLKAE